ncbi:MAG: TatD family hydrolase, partial [Crocinitomicaceae bacterium]|nr:TatD family hydrolase [Crocinitomicaceae bacterium]
MFVDTHTHLFVDQFDEDRVATVQRALDAGVEKLLLPNIDVNSIQPMHDLEKAFPDNCYSMMGLHPGSIDGHWEESLDIVKTNLFSRKYIAVGEIGMDLYWDKTFIEQQKQAFRLQVEWAKELGLPIVIHAREAFSEIFEIVDEMNDDSLTGVFHCFTGSSDDAKHILGYGGFKLGVGGVLTYKNAKLDKVLDKVDLKHIILETDSPYLPPVPHRGKRNESAYLLHVAEELSDVHKV